MIGLCLGLCVKNSHCLTTKTCLINVSANVLCLIGSGYMPRRVFTIQKEKTKNPKRKKENKSERDYVRCIININTDKFH